MVYSDLAWSILATLHVTESDKTPLPFMAIISSTIGRAVSSVPRDTIWGLRPKEENKRLGGQVCQGVMSGLHIPNLDRLGLWNFIHHE